MTEVEVELNRVRQKLGRAMDTLQEKQDQNRKLTDVLNDCVKELCERCGELSGEALGACDGCKWKAVRHGGIDDYFGD